MFLLTMIAGGLDVIIPHNAVLALFGTATAFGGFGLVIAATVLVIFDASYSQRQLDTELLDVPDLANKTGQKPGKVARQQPRNIAKVRD
ncbi:hypothetical protein ACVWZW_001126 [Bradyrhizobium sp. F1.13.4]